MSNSTTANPFNFPLALDDTSIRQALADLDSKLGAWTAAVADAQHVLAQGRNTVSDSEGGTETLDAPVADSVVDEPALGLQGEEPSACEALPAVEPAIVEPDHPLEEAGELQQPCMESASATEPAEQPAEPTEPSDDAAILSSLDEETAKAVQIMRRMSFGKKTLRECLLEYELANSTMAVRQQQERQAKSLWTRGTRWVKKRQK